MDSILPITSKEDPNELFEINKQIGQGAFGTIYIGYQNDKEVAIKIMKIGNEVEEIIHEIEVMKKCHNLPNIVNFFGTYHNPSYNEVWIVMELCEVGSLKSHMIKTRFTFTEKQIGSICLGVLKGLEGLHKNMMIHRDIKADNVIF